MDNILEDLSIAAMNLITLEEHLYFSGVRTDSPGYYDLVEVVRRTRRELMDEMLGETEGEVYCAVKHILSSSVRLFEVGEKFKAAGKEEKAQEYFEKAFEVYTLVWSLISGRLKIPGPENDSNSHGDPTLKERLKTLSKKILNCCEDI